MIESKDMFLVDTNLLVYAYEKENSIRKKKAEELLGKCWYGRINLAVSSQNLAEFASVVNKKAKLNYHQTRINILDIIEFKGFKKIDYSSQTILLAMDIAHEFQMSFWDSLITATMKENGIFNIYTENIKDFKIPWINAINPFNH